MNQTPILLALLLGGYVNQAHTAPPSAEPIQLPASDPPENANFVAQYPQGVWEYGQALPGLNINPCDANVCLAAYNGGATLVQIRTMRTASGGQIVFVISRRCATINAGYANLPLDEQPFVQFVHHAFESALEAAVRACPTDPTVAVPVPDFAKLREAIR